MTTPQPQAEAMSEASTAEGQHSPVTNTTLDASASMDRLDEAYSLTELLTPDMQHIQEFEEILNMLPELPNDLPLKLYEVPEINGLFDGAVSRVQKQFTPKTVVLEIQNIYQLLAVSRSNEDALKKRLKQREEELSDLHSRMRRDPRLYRALVLAGEWRHEKNFEAQTAKEYGNALETMKSEMKDLEMKIHNLQNLNNRISKDLQKIPDLEDSVRIMEEALLERENTISLLETQIDKLKKSIEDSVDTEESIKFFKAATDTHNVLTQKEIERDFKKKMSTLAEEHRQEVNDLSIALERARYAEMSASHNFRNIASSVRLMKQQLKTLESTVEATQRQNARLADDKEQIKKRVADLEDQIHRMRVKEEAMYKQLVTRNHENERLKARLGALGTISKIQSQSDNMAKSFRDKEIEIAACSKNQHKLEKELKFINIQLGESKRLRETQQRELNNTKQLVIVSKQSLTEALRYNDVLFKRLEWTEAYLRYYQRRFDTCTGDNIDIMNTLKHLESLCKEHECTIRIKDARNDSLVLGLSNLEDLLKDAYTNIHRLRQSNLVSQTNHLRQMELNDMMTQLLKFTEAEKVAAVNECNKNVDTVLLLQKQLVQRMNRIAAQYKDMCDLKSTIDKHLQMLELQKKETNGLRDLLNAVRNEDIAKTAKLRVLTQERDTFGAMVIEKNILIQLLEKKIALQEKIMERGATHYRHRADDILILKLEVRNLRHKLAAKEATAEINTELRQELVNACRQLQLEQNKRMAIEELKAPRPHRYVTLKCKDPSQYEQLLRIHKLQKLLIAKHNELTRKEEVIISRDMEIKKLKLFHLRRAGDNSQEQLREATQLLTQKNKQIKGLLSEVNILRFDISECRHDFNEVLRELKIAKEEIAKQKRHTVKDTCQHATKTTDLSVKPVNQKDGFSVECCRTHFKLQPLHNTLQRQRQNRARRHAQHTRRIPAQANELTSRSCDLPSL